MKINPLENGYITRNEVLCMSKETKEEILKELDHYSNSEYVAVVVEGELTEDGIYLYGIYPLSEMDTKTYWRSWAKPVGIIKEMLRG